MQANGSGETPLLDDPASSDIQPVFSGNGKRIIFKNCFSDCDIASVKLDGTGQVGLTDTDTLHETVPDAESIQLCGGRRATILGDDGPDQIKGTKKRDVIDANGGQDVVRGRGGKDIICGGGGPDKLLGGKGSDRLFGGKGRDALRGGPGLDKLRGGPGRDLQRQ
jgi:Ca2+-binding RTX toxin-like protein